MDSRGCAVSASPPPPCTTPSSEAPRVLPHNSIDPSWISKPCSHAPGRCHPMSCLQWEIRRRRWWYDTCTSPILTVTWSEGHEMLARSALWYWHRVPLFCAETGDTPNVSVQSWCNCTWSLGRRWSSYHCDPTRRPGDGSMPGTASRHRSSAERKWVAFRVKRSISVREQTTGHREGERAPERDGGRDLFRRAAVYVPRPISDK